MKRIILSFLPTYPKLSGVDLTNVADTVYWCMVHTLRKCLNGAKGHRIVYFLSKCEGHILGHRGDYLVY